MSDTITKDEARRLIEDIYLREARDMLCVSNGIEAGTILNERVTKALQELEQMPSAQPERKKGQWISRDGKEDCYECSECHAVIEGNEVYWRNNYFCYHCGADMRGEENERNC